MLEFTGILFKVTRMPRDDLPFCECRWLERNAHDPDSPIEFDPEVNEYHLKTKRGEAVIYHCPFCAGRAPESLRAKLFATIPPEEAHRLHELTKDLKTEEEVVARLGEPSRVFDPGVGSGNGEEGSELHMSRSIRYYNHSETAEIHVTVNRYGQVRIGFIGKYLGPPKPPTDTPV